MCNLFQQLVTAFCIVRQNTRLRHHCQLRSSRTSENWWTFFFCYWSIQRYQSAFSQGCKAIQSHSKLENYFYAWFCCLFFGVVVFFPQSNRLCCVPIKLLSRKILSEPFFICFLCFALLELCLLSSLVCWTRLFHEG